MRDELVEAVARAIEEFFCASDRAYGVHIDAAKAALAVAEPAIRADEQERAAALIERRNPNEGGRLDALAIRAGQGERG